MAARRDSAEVERPRPPPCKPACGLHQRIIRHEEERTHAPGERQSTFQMGGRGWRSEVCFGGRAREASGASRGRAAPFAEELPPKNGVGDPRFAESERRHVWAMGEWRGFAPGCDRQGDRHLPRSRTLGRRRGSRTGGCTPPQKSRPLRGDGAVVAGQTRPPAGW
jgi:hypothetical protein